MRLRILHDTRYDYRPPVAMGQHLAHLKPLNNGCQRLLSHQLRITPRPSLLRETVDEHGNACHHFSLEGEHAQLLVQSDSLVETWAPPTREREATAAWEQVQSSLRGRSDTQALPALRFAWASPGVGYEPAFMDFAQPSFSPGRPIAEAAWDLMRRIHRDMRYESCSTEVGTPPLEALRQGKGVCQDFAHILIGCCRALGLPARYVSGYLLTQAPPGQARLIGSDASHAWASVYCPSSGDPASPGFWLDLDPTNDRAPAEDYVTVALGRDFQDVSPLAGVIRGGEHHELSVAVTVLPEQDGGDPSPGP